MPKEKKLKKKPYMIGFSKRNYLAFIFGILMIIVGYFVMATGHVDSFQSLTLAPILLFLGYIVLIPISLILPSEDE